MNGRTDIEKAKKLFTDYEIERSPAEWAFRWLWNQPEVTCVLSGMNSLEMVQENIKNAVTSKVGEFTDKEEDLLKDVVQTINEKMKVDCTGCGKCEQHCPQNIKICEELKNAKKVLEGPLLNMSIQFIIVNKLFICIENSCNKYFMILIATIF